MSLTLAFDIYGTLIDPHGVVVLLREMVGERAPAVSATWRGKQLEYAFRRGLMRRYENFAVCTAQALDYACAEHGLSLTASDKQRLLDAYGILPAFDDAASGLAALSAQGHRMVAFSNGVAAAVEGLLEHAGIREHFDGVVSVDEVGSFKPDPGVYELVLERMQCEAADTWLVSSNPFDVLGALHAGLKAAWVQRDPSTPFDPWGEAPTLTVSSLDELPGALVAQQCA